MKRILLIFMALGLSVVVASNIVFTIFVPEVEPTMEQRLGELLPAEVSGWKSREVALSDTPEGAERVLDILNLDDVYCREFVRGDTRIMIYAAYWFPGSEPYSAVAIHNPDSCWVIAGWEIKERESNRHIEMAGHDLKQHEWGIYQKAGNDVHVMFWHLLGGEPNDYIKDMVWTSTGLDSIKRQFYFLLNLQQMGLELGRDQLFIRVSSNKPFEELESDPHFRRLFERLNVLQIFQDDTDPIL